MFDAKAHVQDGRKVRFVKATAKELWYETELGLQFPVPISDIHDGIFLAEDKAMLFLRYIRRHGAIVEGAREAA